MPPLSTHRELLETVGNVQAEINRWEPGVAMGQELLPTPTIYKVNKEINFNGTEGFSAGKTTQHLGYKTRLDSEGKPLQQYYDYHYAYGVHEVGDQLVTYNWIDGESYTSKDATHLPMGVTHPTEEITQVKNHEGINFLHRQTDEDGNTVWTIAKWDARGRHTIAETVDSTGKLIQVRHDLLGAKRAANYTTSTEQREKFEYSYSSDGRLTREVYTVTRDSESEELPQETTIFRYLPSGIVSHVTVDKQGKEIRRGIRYYDEQGRFLKAKIEENLPGEGRQRVIGQTALSYCPIEEPLELPLR